MLKLCDLRQSNVVKYTLEQEKCKSLATANLMMQASNTMFVGAILLLYEMFSV